MRGGSLKKPDCNARAAKGQVNAGDAVRDMEGANSDPRLHAHLVVELGLSRSSVDLAQSLTAFDCRSSYGNRHPRVLLLNAQDTQNSRHIRELDRLAPSKSRTPGLARTGCPPRNRI